MIIEICAATAHDIPTLIAISQRTIMKMYPPFLGEEAVSAYVASGAVSRFFQDNIDACLIASLGAHLIGCASAKRNVLDLIIIDSDLHGRGYGSKLLEAVEERLGERPCVLTLNSFRDNDQANGFYRKNGWQVDREFVDPETHIPMVRMCKTLMNSG
ncbi:MAG: GNAT family N-acetyltransferase [Alphaproteobacteria bacterium]